MKMRVLLVMVLAACGAPMAERDGGSVDAGTVPDAGVMVDAGADAGPQHEHDAGAPDAGALDAGTDAFVMLAEFPAAIARTNNELHVELSEHGGAAINGATVTLALWYPDHGHGAVAPTATEATPGHFHALVNFPMAGTCEVTVTAVSSGRTVVEKLTVLVP